MDDDVTLNPVLSAGPEFLKRIYFRPDYHAVISLYSGVLARRLDEDQEALEAFKDLIGPQEVDLNETERVAPLVAYAIVAGVYAAGVALGYFAERGAR